MHHLFLSGPSGAGKSTLLRTQLAPFADSAAGFVCRRILEGECTAGFCAARIEGSLPPLIAHTKPVGGEPFLYKGVQNLGALEAAIECAVTDAGHPRCRFVLLDEIGGIELVSDAFMANAYRLLSGPLPCIGVLKSPENLRRTLENQHLHGDYALRHAQLCAKIKAAGRIIATTRATLPEAQEEVEAWMQANLP